MTSTPTPVQTVPDAAVMAEAPGVFASGRSGGRRWLWVGIGALMLVLAWIALEFGGDFGVAVALAMFLGGPTAIVAAFWRRSKRFEIRREGIKIQDGGRVFGESTLIAWPSVRRLAARRMRGDRVLLYYQQTHDDSRCTLPGGVMKVSRYDRLMDRLRFVLKERHPHLQLGGLDG